jgi:hypothetical protein
MLVELMRDAAGRAVEERWRGLNLRAATSADKNVASGRAVLPTRPAHGRQGIRPPTSHSHVMVTTLFTLWPALMCTPGCAAISHA